MRSEFNTGSFFAGGKRNIERITHFVVIENWLRHGLFVIALRYNVRRAFRPGIALTQSPFGKL